MRACVFVCLIVGDLENSKRGGLGPIWAMEPQQLCHWRPRQVDNIKFNIIGNNITEGLTCEIVVITVPLPKLSN